jgi:hypothetical protein
VGDFDAEENDVGAYKHFEPTVDGLGDDDDDDDDELEPTFDDLDDY